MKRLFNNKITITAMLLVAGYTIYTNIVTPFMHTNDYASDRPDMFAFDEEATEADAATQRFAKTAVNTSVLFWDDVPGRDPFTHQMNSRKIAYKANVLRSQLKHQSGGKSIPHLTGFVAGTDSRLAVVNNKVVSIGQKVSGYTVLDINPQGVHLVDINNRARLKLKLEQKK